jgi:hypothetical protein
MELVQNLQTVLQILTVFGVFAAVWAVLQAKTSLRAQTVMKLIEDWRDPELYEAIRYINSLRTEWKKTCSPVTDKATWDKLASKWVDDYYPGKEEQTKKEWLARRQASQFLSKTGLLTMRGYMRPEDLFVVPEMGRYLMVLTPIELAILQKSDFEKPIADWDHPAVKWEFNYLWSEYMRWFKKNSNKIKLNPLEYSLGTSSQI